MILNFEGFTHPITEEEKDIIIGLVKGLEKRVGKEKAIKGPQIVAGINLKMKLKKKFTEIRLRKLINLIRSESVLPMMATSKGYYLSYDAKEIKECIISLTDRAEGIMSAANGLYDFIPKQETE